MKLNTVALLDQHLPRGVENAYMHDESVFSVLQSVSPLGSPSGEGAVHIINVISFHLKPPAFHSVTLPDPAALLSSLRILVIVPSAG